MSLSRRSSISVRLSKKENSRTNDLCRSPPKWRRGSKPKTQLDGSYLKSIIRSPSWSRLTNPKAFLRLSKVRLPPMSFYAANRNPVVLYMDAPAFVGQQSTSAGVGDGPCAAAAQE